MNEMLLQKFLRGGGTPAELMKLYAIKTTRHGQYPNLVLFKYNQIDSPFAEPLVRECRGVILDEADGWRCVSRSFDKFFNHGEGHAAPIDWATARVMEKVDGSLLTLYHYRDAWHVATTGMPDAAGEVNGCGFTFADLFWRAIRETGVESPMSFFAPGHSYMFELTSPYNRVVVPHKTLGLTLLGMRYLEGGVHGDVPFMEHSPAYLDGVVCPMVRQFPLQSFDDCCATFSALNPMDQEGYVVVDAQWNRVKVKHPGYVAIHHLRDGFGPRRLLEIIRTGEAPELLTYYPEWRPDFEKIELKFNALVADLEGAYEAIKHLEVQKDFALEAVKTRVPPALFNLRKGNVKSVREHLAGMNIKHLVSLLGIRDQEPQEVV